MSGIGSLFNAGLGGLGAATAGMQTTGNNISNVNTPGYNRQSILQGTRLPDFSGAGYIGQGAQVNGVVRSYDQYLQNQVWQSTSASSGLGALRDQLDQLNDLLSSSDSGLSPAMDEFFSAVQAVTSPQAGLPERQSLISNANVLAARFNALDGRMNDMAQGINVQLQEHVAVINGLTRDLAELNVKIVSLQGEGAGQQPNDLLDQREELITRLNKEVGVSVVRQDNGQLNVFTGNGQALVAGGKAYALKVQPGLYDTQRLEVAYAATGAEISRGLSGGVIGGLLQYRDTSLEPARQALGRMAAGLALEANQQQALGLDLDGELGQPLFHLPKPDIHGSRLNASPTAALDASITDAGKLQNSDYQVGFDGSSWQVKRLSDGQEVATGASGPLQFDGLQLDISGSAKAGDKFLLQPTQRAGAGLSVALSDPRGIAAAAPYVSNTGNNAGDLRISAGQVADTPGDISLPDAAFGQEIRVSFSSATAFEISYGDPATTVPGGPFTYAPGMRIDVAYPAPAAGSAWQVQLDGGAAAAGDSFTLSKSGPGDNRNAQALAALSARPVLDQDDSTLQQAYGQLITRVGSAGREAQSVEKAQANLLQQVQQRQQSMSGVNLDEEAANLMRYQQAYQAAGKVIQVANSLFDTILDL